MAEFDTTELEDIEKAFLRMESAAVTAVPKMLKAGGKVLVDAQKAELSAMGVNDTGGLAKSIKATTVKGDETEKYVDIYPHGRASHGNEKKGDKSNVRYATIGFITEYGTSSRIPRPYMTAAKEKAKDKIVEAELEVWEKETNV